MYGRKGTEDESTEVIQEHPRAPSTPPPSAQLDLIRPIDHLISTTTRTQRYHMSHGTSSRTQSNRPLTDDYDMLHLSLQLRGCETIRLRLHVAARSCAVEMLRSPERTLVLVSCV